jgi:hypothetical protein
MTSHLKTNLKNLAAGAAQGLNLAKQVLRPPAFHTPCYTRWQWLSARVMVTTLSNRRQTTQRNRKLFCPAAKSRK